MNSKIQIIKAEYDFFKTKYSLDKKVITERVDGIVGEIGLNREDIKSLEKLSKIERVIHAEVTAYTLSISECNEDLDNTAAMLKPRLGMVAVSRDLFYDGWVFGKKIYVQGLGIFVVGDLMNQRWEKRIDILFPTKEKANRFGKQTLKVALLNL
jgi:3D (Asp-Asp-Asp) domain-containing protein